MEIQLHSLFVLSLPLHLVENFFTTIFNFNEFIFLYVLNIRFIWDGEIYSFVYSLTHPTHSLTYLLTFDDINTAIYSAAVTIKEHLKDVK